MILHRQYRKTVKPDGSVHVFDPLVCWMYQDGIGWIGLRGGWDVGFLWRFRVGSFSRYRKRWIEIGKLTLFVNLGECAPHNPRQREAAIEV